MTTKAKVELETDDARHLQQVRIKMKSALFEYAIIYNPKPTKDAQGNETTPPSVLLVTPTTILAKRKEDAEILAARAIPSEYISKLDEIDIAIRPF